jgi:hypothetical protein
MTITNYEALRYVFFSALPPTCFVCCLVKVLKSMAGQIIIPVQPENMFRERSCITYVHSRKQKLTALYIQIARQAVQSSSEFYDFL